MPDGTCSVEGCGRSLHGRGWCSRHYSAWRHHGDPLAEVARHYSTPTEALAARTVREGDCVLWVGSRTNLGYGLISITGRLEMVHRYVWASVHGVIPEDVEIDHSCHNPPCCNVQHLRSATRHQNMRNRNGAQSTSGTGVRNVRAEGDRYRVVVNREHVGTFCDIDTARAAAEVARSAKFGAYAGSG